MKTREKKPDAAYLLSEQGTDDATLKLESRLEREAPYSIEAEQCLLGCLLIDPNAFFKICDVTKIEHFYKQPHQLIYEAIVQLSKAGESIDVITVAEQLNDTDKLTLSGGRAYISDLALSVLTTENVEAYAQMVKDKATLRQFIHIGTNLVDLAYNIEEPQKIIDLSQEAIFRLTMDEVKQDITPIGDLMREVFEDLEKRAETPDRLTGIPSGFYDLDNMLLGFQPGDLVILAARPSMGKTAFALNIAAHVAIRCQKHVVIFSLEMKKKQLIERLWCGEAETDSQRVRSARLTDNDWGSISKTWKPLEEAAIQIDETSGLNLMQLRAKVRKAQIQSGRKVDMIIVDYLQLMESVDKGSSSGNRNNEISQISRGLKQLAKDFECPIFCLSQLSRGVESRPDKKPMMSDLRESGAIEQDADVVMFIYRDEYYNKDTDRPGTADIIVAKQRNGPVGEVSLLFRHNITKFVNPLDMKYKAV